MRTFLLTTLKRFRRDDEGVTLVEYGIALILAVTVGTLALTSLGDEVSASMDEAGTLMPGDVAVGP